MRKTTIFAIGFISGMIISAWMFTSSLEKHMGLYRSNMIVSEVANE